MVVLVPDAQVRERIRAIASSAAIDGVQTSFYVAHELIEACVRDTRRALFDGPLAVLTRDEPGALRALSAGADEAFSLESFALDAASWSRLVARTRIKSEARRESAQRLAAVSELEKLCALGRLVSGVAEGLSDPLTSALLSLEVLQAELAPLYAGLAELDTLSASEQPLAASALRAIVEQARRGATTPERARAVLDEVTDTCRTIAQVAHDLGVCGDAHERYELVDLRATLDQILRLFRRAAAKSTHIELDYAEDLPEVFAPRARVVQVLVSLLSNALASLRELSRDLRRLRISLRADDAVVTVTVSDSGPGLAAGVLARIFDPFAACGERDESRRAAHGIGLELAVARSTIRALGGDLMVESLRGEGTTFVAWLPRPKERAPRRSDTAPRRAWTRESQRCVLVLEPDRQVLSALSRLLRERYDVRIAWLDEQARSLIASGTRPDAIVAATDDAEGQRFVAWLLLERPDLARRLLLTTANVELCEELIGLPWLEKPLEPAALYREIEARFVPPLRKARGPEPATKQTASRR